MLVTDDVAILDLFNGDRPGWPHVSLLEDVIVFTADVGRPVVAA